MTKVAVVLSGCGVFDGSEVYETVITLLRLDSHNVEVQAFAPNMEQAHVINHFSGEVSEGESRNVLVEAARLVRGEIKNLAEAKAEDFDALIVPGGFGAAKNLSDFAFKGAELTVNTELVAFSQAMHAAGKPVGLMCIAPVMAAILIGEGTSCTIGNDTETAAAIEQAGAVHVARSVTDTCIDTERKLVTTPAYMLAESISQAAEGINKLVDDVLKMITNERGLQ